MCVTFSIVRGKYIQQNLSHEVSSYLHYKVLYSYPFLGIISILQCYKIDIKELSSRKKQIIYLFYQFNILIQYLQSQYNSTRHIQTTSLIFFILLLNSGLLTFQKGMQTSYYEGNQNLFEILDQNIESKRKTQPEETLLAFIKLLPQFKYQIGSVGKALIGVWEHNGKVKQVVYEQYQAQQDHYGRQVASHQGPARIKIVEKLLQLIQMENWMKFKTSSKQLVIDEMLKKVWAK